MKTKLGLALLLTFALAGFRQANAAISLVAPRTEPMKAATAAQSKMFRALYAKGDAATLRRDVASSVAMLTDEFMFCYKSGIVLKKPQLTALLKQIMKRVVKFNAVQTQIKLVQRAEKKVFFVTATSRIDMTYRGLDEKIHRSVSICQMSDSWLLTKQGWRVQNSQELETRSTVDGHEATTTLSSTR